MQPGPPRRRRARPVADAPVDALVLRAEDLAKGWLLALVEDTPLEEASRILAGEVARDGPRLCEAVVRALADDTDLRRLEPGGALELLVTDVGALAGAADSAMTSSAVDALQAVIWSALREELRTADADLVSELAERLAMVTEVVRAAALRRGAGSRARLRDASAGAGRRQSDLGGRRDTDIPAPRGSDLAARDVLWMNAVEDEIARAQGAGTPLSLLLVELDDADRMVGAATEAEASATFGRFAQAVRGAVRRQDILACESDSRAWIIGLGTGRPGAQALGTRVAGAVRAAESWRGAPLTVSVGVAVLGEDGGNCEELIASAEEAKFTASASGIEIIRAEAGEPPAGPSLVG